MIFEAFLLMKKNYISIYSALIANVLIAVIKFIAGAFSNSTSMISEGIHSMVVKHLQLLQALAKPSY